MNVNPYNTRDYENKSNWTLGQSKPNSKPIQTQSKPVLSAACPERREFTLSVIEGNGSNGPITRMSQMNVNSLITKDYRKKDDFAVQKNKLNFFKDKMNVSTILIKDYENIPDWTLIENKPNQSLS
ncbi:unnamed protein product [marine sediment metagenome]|uniref:Uncharacterized protein n=1 Tax=marine sediment metagenome TaxID=412755 RepID=X0WMI4_9ZZZZ